MFSRNILVQVFATNSRALEVQREVERSIAQVLPELRQPPDQSFLLTFAGGNTEQSIFKTDDHRSTEIYLFLLTKKALNKIWRSILKLFASVWTCSGYRYYFNTNPDLFSLK